MGGKGVEGRGSGDWGLDRAPVRVVGWGLMGLNERPGRKPRRPTPQSPGDSGGLV